MNTINTIHSNIRQKNNQVVTSSTPIPDLMWYKFNGNISNYKVSNSPVGDATLGGGPNVFVSSRLAGQMCFGSTGGVTSNFVNFPLVARPQTITFSCWIFLTSVAPFARIFDFGENFRLYFPGGGRVVLNNNAASLQYATSNFGVWKHIAFSISGVNLVFYESGVFKQNIVLAAPLPSINTATFVNPSNGYLAKSQSSADPNPVCKFSDFRLYGRVLTAVEIGILYNTTT
jgi:hypothetical protein